jgi:hypothetical protein
MVFFALLTTFSTLLLYSPKANRDGRIRTGDLLRPRQADYQTFPRPGRHVESWSMTLPTGQGGRI